LRCEPQRALRTLDLSGNEIGAAGARAIADVILAEATQLDAVILTRGADLPIGQLRRNRLATLNLRQKELVRLALVGMGWLLSKR
jgi:Ran GTPase-activating protein (RanGAP) involved in mRNA processing and transport